MNEISTSIVKARTMTMGRGRVDRRARLILICGLVFTVLAGLDTPGTAGPGGFRCATTGRLVSTGQSLFEVRNRCREPDEALSSIEVRTVREKVRRWVNGVSEEQSVERTVDVPVDEWTYDFGRNRFIELLRFGYGRLIWVREGGKGFADPE